MSGHRQIWQHWSREPAVHGPASKPCHTSVSHDRNPPPNSHDDTAQTLPPSLQPTTATVEAHHTRMVIQVLHPSLYSPGGRRSRALRRIRAAKGLRREDIDHSGDIQHGDNEKAQQAHHQPKDDACTGQGVARVSGTRLDQRRGGLATAIRVSLAQPTKQQSPATHPKRRGKNEICGARGKVHRSRST